MRSLTRATVNLVLIALGVAALHACAGSHLRTAPTGADRISPARSATAGRACLASVTAQMAGVSYTVSPQFIEQVRSNLIEAGLFAGVDRTPCSDAAATRLSLHLDEQQDIHRGANTFKGAVIGLSFFSLIPVLPLHYDYAVTATLEAVRGDAAERRYTARSAGTAYYHLFSTAGAASAGNDLRRQASTQALNGVMNQMVGDAGFYAPTTAEPGAPVE